MEGVPVLVAGDVGERDAPHLPGLTIQQVRGSWRVDDVERRAWIERRRRVLLRLRVQRARCDKSSDDDTREQLAHAASDSPALAAQGLAPCQRYHDQEPFCSRSAIIL